MYLNSANGFLIAVLVDPVSAILKAWILLKTYIFSFSTKLVKYASMIVSVSHWSEFREEKSLIFKICS